MPTALWLKYLFVNQRVKIESPQQSGANANNDVLLTFRLLTIRHRFRNTLRSKQPFIFSLHVDPWEREEWFDSVCLISFLREKNGE